MSEQATEEIDKKSIIDYVFTRTGIVIDDKDPVFALVALNEKLMGGLLKTNIELIEKYITTLLESSSVLQQSLEHYTLKKGISIYSDVEKIVSDETSKALDKINNEAVKKISDCIEEKFSIIPSVKNKSSSSTLIIFFVCSIVFLCLGYFANEITNSVAAKDLKERNFILEKQVSALDKMDDKFKREYLDKLKSLN